MKKIFLLTLLVPLLIGCEQKDQKRSTTTREDVDNTERNMRDRDPDAITPMDQSESKEDRRITQEIRKSIMADDSLSSNAKNVKVITIDSKVTLRGVVDSNQEKQVLASKANQVNGVKNVDNQLEVKKNK